jgi:hypothetical protein
MEITFKEYREKLTEQDIKMIENNLTIQFPKGLIKLKNFFPKI